MESSRTISVIICILVFDLSVANDLSSGSSISSSPGISNSENNGNHNPNAGNGPVKPNFSIDIYKASISGESGNIIISPFSLTTCLALLFYGAAGQTASTLGHVLGFNNQTQLLVAKDYQRILSPLQNQSNLEIGTAIFVQNVYTVQKSYMTVAKDYFFATVTSLNFRNPNRAASTINNWISQKTNQLIPNAISPQSIISATGMVLVNAIYFKGTWKYQFDPSKTRKEKFNTEQCAESDSKMIYMMNIKSNFNYGNILNAQVLEIPYNDGETSMVVLLPYDCNGLSKLEAQLNFFDFSTLSWYFNPQQVIVTFPKFSFDFSISYNGPLKSLGLGVIFNETIADFNNILSTQSTPIVPLYVSQVFQRALIEVNEEGSEAAAVTYFRTFGLTRPGPPPPGPTVFVANHPFIFMIKRNADILFMGRYTGGNV